MLTYSFTPAVSILFGTLLSLAAMCAHLGDLKAMLQTDYMYLLAKFGFDTAERRQVIFVIKAREP